MKCLAVPHEATTTSATLWLAFVDREAPPAAGDVMVRGAGIAVQPPPASWRRLAGFDRPVLWQAIAVQGLVPGARLPVVVEDRGAVVARATLTTLPDRAPVDAPLRILLASCFPQRSDRAGRASQTLRMLQGSKRPVAKLLCGDQVYLDSPWFAYMFRTYGKKKLPGRLLDQYLDTWSPPIEGAGLTAFLEEGATWFTADDHEFWNNAPFKTPIVLTTRTPGGRARWHALAAELYSAFQSGRDAIEIPLPRPWAAFVLDTRRNRDTDRRRFSTDQALARLDAWIRALSGPGLLVLGQPLVDEPAGSMGKWGDWHLADFRQYDDLARIVAGSTKPLVMLSGDLHEGRIAHGRLSSGTPLVEVLASPLALVEGLPRGKADPAPSRFPTRPVPGVVPITMQTVPDSPFSGDHFTLLELSAVGDSGRLAVEQFPLPRLGDAPSSRLSWTMHLH